MIENYEDAFKSAIFKKRIIERKIEKTQTSLENKVKEVNVLVNDVNCLRSELKQQRGLSKDNTTANVSNFEKKKLIQTDSASLEEQKEVENL